MHYSEVLLYMYSSNLLQHSELLEEAGSKPQKPKQIKSGYDPFKLVPCQSFTADCPVSEIFYILLLHCNLSTKATFGWHKSGCYREERLNI